MRLSRTVLLIFITTVCIAVMIQLAVLFPVSVDAMRDNFVIGTATQQSLTPTPSPSPTPLKFNLHNDGKCPVALNLTDAEGLNIPVRPLPVVQTPESLSCLLQTPNDQPTPVPTPMDYLPRLGTATRLDSYAIELADYFQDNQQDGVEGIRKWLGDRDLLCTANPCPNDLVAGDFNGNGRTEYILTLSLRGKPFSDLPGECGAYVGLAQRVYILSCQTNPDFCFVHPVGRLWENAENSGCINSIADINNDGQLELLVTYHLCGASDCWNQLEIVSLSEGFHYLAPPIEVHNGCIIGYDENGDGTVEIFAATTDFPGSAGFLADSSGNPTFGPHQSYVSVFHWDGSEYTFAGRAYNHGCLFHVIWDGIDWAKQGEPQTALRVFEIALTNQDIPFECRSEDDVEFQWRTYAQFAVGMLNAQLGRDDEARDALLKVKDIDSENIFSPLVDVFLESYDTGCFDVACQALTEYVNALDNRPFRGPYRYRKLTTFCPNDMMK